MNNVEEFKEHIIIEWKEENKAYGHFPFQMFSKSVDGSNSMTALVMGNVEPCYKAFNARVKNGGCPVFMSIDFPKMAEIEHDFIAVYEWDGKDMKLTAIPYDGVTGERFAEIDFRESEILMKIMQQFCFLTLQEANAIVSEDNKNE